MTRAEQNRYWRQWHRFQQKYEKKYEQKFNKALQLQVDAFIKYKDLMMIPNLPIYTVLNDLYKTVGPAWVNATKSSMTKATGQMGFNERIVELMRQYYGIDLLNDAQGITDYTREVIGKILAEAAQEGWSFDEIVRRLRTAPELSAMRARRIARTETVTSANQAAMLYAQTSGNVMEKTWIAVRDQRTRHDHLIVDGTRLPIDEPFSLSNRRAGIVQMMQPGVREQPNGLAVPADEVINCRCVVAFRALRGPDGRLLSRP
jgi:SPP1 gp7 family putative phage head morphogenesis protein